MRPLVLAASLLCACSAIPVRLINSAPISDREAEAVIVEACAALGQHCEIVGRWGAIEAELIYSDGRVRGRGWHRGCRSRLWADPRRVEYVAHELGHVLGLEHVDDDDNLMYAHSPTFELRGDQLDEADRVAGRLSACP